MKTILVRIYCYLQLDKKLKKKKKTKLAKLVAHLIIQIIDTSDCFNFVFQHRIHMFSSFVDGMHPHQHFPLMPLSDRQSIQLSPR
jgi:hypothetical protein